MIGPLIIAFIILTVVLILIFTRRNANNKSIVEDILIEYTPKVEALNTIEELEAIKTELSSKYNLRKLIFFYGMERLMTSINSKIKKLKHDSTGSI